MKETQVAKRNIEIYKEVEKLDLTATQVRWVLCTTHKATCQRFLEFLEEQRMELKDKGLTWLDFKQKITDLKQAIKEYDDNGI